LKSDAEDLATEIKPAIKDGTFGKRAPVAEMTLRVVRDWLGHGDVKPVSVYLSTTMASQYDAMAAFEARFAAARTAKPDVQECASEVGRGDHTRLSAALGREEKLDETANGRETAVM